MTDYCELRKGQKYITASGLTAICTEYRNAHDIEISYSDGSRRRTKWTVFLTEPDSPLVPKKLPKNTEASVDHLGNVYPSKTAMLKHYGVTMSVFQRRIKSGKSLEEALTQQGNSNYKTGIKDHLGNEYTSEDAMCRHYNIKHNTFQRRIKKGWNLEDALTKPVVSTTQECTDHLGNKYKNKSEMCKAWGVRRETLNANLRKGMSLKDALETPTEDYSIPYQGTIYRSANQLAKAAGVNYGRLSYHLRNGATPEEAVEKSRLMPIDRTGEEKTMKCGLKLKLIEKLEKGYMGQFENGTVVRIRDASAFLERCVKHPTLKSAGKGIFAGFDTSGRLEMDDDNVYYCCTCRICGFKSVMTPQQMMGHSKQHTEICQ